MVVECATRGDYTMEKPMKSTRLLYTLKKNWDGFNTVDFDEILFFFLFDFVFHGHKYICLSALYCQGGYKRKQLLPNFQPLIDLVYTPVW